MVWVPVTVCLLIFSISSSYFTHLKYRDNYNVRTILVKKDTPLGRETDRDQCLSPDLIFDQSEVRNLDMANGCQCVRPERFLELV